MLSSGGLPMLNNKLLLGFVAAASLLTVVLRILPHAPNFTPVGALSLFIGAYFSGKSKFVLPVLIMGVSDFFLGFYDYRLMFVVYGSLLVVVGLGSLMHNRVSSLKIGLGALGGTTLFFLLTNLAVWGLASWYPPTIGGLITAYMMGLPFLKMTLLGDLFYSAVFFGAYEFVRIAGLYKLGYTLPVRVRIGMRDTALLEKKRFDNI
jgi:hypothetical protein